MEVLCLKHVILLNLGSVPSFGNNSTINLKLYCKMHVFLWHWCFVNTSCYMFAVIFYFKKTTCYENGVHIFWIVAT